MSKNNNEIKHEDLIMKKAMDVFAEEGLKFFGINQKVKDSSSTEIVVLEALNLHMDYTFLMEDDSYIHFEFQTTNKGKKDLRRFRAYEALLSLQKVASDRAKSPLARTLRVQKITSDKHYISYVRKSMAFCFKKNYFQKISKMYFT